MKMSTFFRSAQLFWAYFIALGAILGFAMMLYDPSGKTFNMDMLLPQLRDAFPFFSSIFQDFTYSAFTLLAVNGVTNMISIYLIHTHNQFDAISGLSCGAILLVWISVEFYIWGFSGLSIAYGIFAILQILNAILFLRAKRDSLPR